MSKSEIDNLKSRFADGVSSRLRGGGERQTGRYSDIYDFETPKVNRKTPVKPKSTTSEKKKASRSPIRATSPRRALSPRRATSPRPRPASSKKKAVSTPANKQKSDTIKTFKTPKSATKNVPSTSTPKSMKVSKKRKSNDNDDDESEEAQDDSNKKRKREADPDAKTKKRAIVRKRVSFRGDELASNPSKSSKSLQSPKEEKKLDESDNSASWWFCQIM